MDDMPRVCPHPKSSWFNDWTGEEVFAKHPPTIGKATYSKLQRITITYAVTRCAPWGSSVPYVPESLVPYPDLLDRYLAAKMLIAIYTQFAEKTALFHSRASRRRPITCARACSFQGGHTLVGLITWGPPTDGQGAGRQSSNRGG